MGQGLSVKAKVVVSPATSEQLKAEASARGISVAQVVRDALHLYFTDEDRRPAQKLVQMPTGTNGR